jgi:hypothetical protein
MIAMILCCCPTTFYYSSCVCGNIFTFLNKWSKNLTWEVVKFNKDTNVGCFPSMEVGCVCENRMLALLLRVTVCWLCCC